MAIRHMLVDEITVLNRELVGTDPMGRQRYEWTERRTRGFIAQRRGEDLPGQGEVSLNKRVLYLEYGEQLADGDRVIDYDGVVWTVAGPPLRHSRPWAGPHHIEAYLELLEGK